MTAERLGQRILGKFVAASVVGVPPLLMGIGPWKAIPVALQKAGISKFDVDIYEINEAFASQSLACIRMLKLNPEKVNVRGGAIAIGHPLGASGARITTTLLNNMIDRGATVGLATMCIGVGQGIGTIFQRV